VTVIHFPSAEMVKVNDAAIYQVLRRHDIDAEIRHSTNRIYGPTRYITIHNTDPYRAAELVSEDGDPRPIRDGSGVWETTIGGLRTVVVAWAGVAA
jgi:hypothetical protein